VSDRGADIASSSGEETSFHPVAGGGVLFNAREGRLYALNPVAGLAWLCLQDGLSLPEGTEAISNAFKLRPSVAAEWFSASMRMFQDFGLLGTAQAERLNTRFEQVSPRGAQSEAPRSRGGVRYQLLEKSFSIAAPAEVQPVIDSLLANLRIDSTEYEGPRFLHIDVTARDSMWDIAVGGRSEVNCSTESVAAEIERLLVRTIVPATPHLLTLHAAALQRSGRSFVLAGQSGIGKTSLSLALQRAGWDFGSDEIVLLTRDLRLKPLPLPPCIKADVFSTVESWFPHLRAAPAHNRYGKRIKYLQVRSGELDSGPGYVVFPRYDRGGGNEIQPLDSFLGLQRLLAQCVFVPSAFEHEDVELLLQWHSTQRYFDVQYNHCDAAVDFLAHIDERELKSV
jgi:hypothetical protein